MDESVVLIEKNVSIVTIDDSDEEGACLVDEDGDKEEGEVMADNVTEDCDNFLFEINFKNHETFQIYKNLLVQALENAFNCSSQNIKLDSEDNESRLLAYACCNASEQENATSVADMEKLRKSESKSPDLTGIKELFTIDTEPSNKPDSVQVPSYKRSLKSVLDEEPASSKRQKTEDTCKRVRQTASCFNCGSKDHPMRECPKPRNNKRIQNARQSFKRHADQRYHIQKGQYPHLLPGVISPQLKRALGLRGGDLPYFFYRMRVLGYPPGWLEEAKVKHSGLTLFSADGSKDAAELDACANSTQDKYDVSKIIDFPGFNMVPAHKFFDDYKYHNVPPMDSSHMKDTFVRNLGDNVIKGYKRKRMSNFANETDALPADEVCMEPTDMEVVETDDDDVIEISEVVEPPGTKTTILDDVRIDDEENSKNTVIEIKEDGEMETTTELEASTVRSPSPSIADLMAQQNALLAALGDQSTLNESALTEASQIVEEEPKTESRNVDKTIEIPEIPLPKPIIKESHAGTPLLKFSPFDKLPSGDKFKVGVSDVINFENLPDSTGKYEQMKLVISKVRQMVRQIHDEDD